jgi:hypothetical protein
MMKSPRIPLSHGLALALALAPSVTRAQPQEPCGTPLVLRVSDTIAPPAGVAAVVLRTYASRPVGQGQIDLMVGGATLSGARSAGAAEPVISLEGVWVFSGQGDAVSVGSFDPLQQVASLAFASPTGSVNDLSGPLAVFFLRLSADLQPGDRHALDLALPEGFLVDAAGRPVPIHVRSGELTVRSAVAPLAVEAEDDRVVPGKIAGLGLATQEGFAISAGQLALEWDPAVAGGEPQVSMDPRHGNGWFAIVESLPGRLVVIFGSADASLNTVPGTLVRVDLPTSPEAPVGTESPVTLDPSATHLIGPEGALPIVLEDGLLEFRAAEPLVFRDGFECGDPRDWSFETM